jgi:hypothetical protein
MKGTSHATNQNSSAFKIRNTDQTALNNGLGKDEKGFQGFFVYRNQ